MNTTTAVMTHDDDVANPESRHTVRNGGDGIEIRTSVLVRDVAFSEEVAGERRENGPFGNSGVAVWVIRC